MREPRALQAKWATILAALTSGSRTQSTSNSARPATRNDETALDRTHAHRARFSVLETPGLALGLRFSDPAR